MISETFSQQTLSILRKVLREQLFTWTEIVTKELDSLLKIYQKYFQNLEKLRQNNAPLFLLIKELENGMIDLLKWTNTISDIPNKLSKAGMWTRWQEESNKMITDISESLDLEIAQSFWQTSSSDSLKIKLWKWKNRQQRGVIARGYQILNWSRWLLRKPKKFPKTRVRRVYSRQFFEMYLQIPASEIIIKQWQAFLLRTAKILFEIHLDSEQVKDRLLFMNDILSICRPLDSNKLSEYFSHIENTRQKILSFQQELKESLLSNFTQLSEEWQKLFSDATNNWLYAGTFILPTKAYNRSKRQSAWKVIENKFSEFKSAWLLHYDGEKNEWLKDLELSLLEIKTTLACQKTLDAIETKITKNFLPPLEKAKQYIKNSLEKFTSIEVRSTEELEKAIIQENKNLLKVMRKDSLPEIMDSILEANLEGSIQAYLSESKEALASLSDKHVVFRFRDLNNTPPHSKVNEISLEELIKDDFFKELYQNQEKVLTEIHSRLEHTLRDISEIDQIVEFNLEAALNLLQEGKENAQEETHKIVIQGLQRTFNQINDLVESSLQIYTLCQEELTKITSNFENKVKDLEDSEKIFELKLRVAQAKTREKFRNNVKRLWQFAKQILPLITQFISTRLKDISNYYRRLRKITGLAPRTIRIEEELTKFLTETQLRIKALPYVYQRLFRLEPLEDERFFAGRNSELERLKEQFRKWENGQYAATALVGERGSGKTTLLKFAEQLYYSRYPLIKHDLIRTTYQEEGLLKKLTEILKMNEVKDFDELKDQILGSRDKKIVILENMQNMFLRVIDGFQSVERFLLLVSQTDSQIYWITTCTLYSWQYLDKILGLSKYFQNVITLGDLLEEEVKTIILKRHRVSGFEISYPEPEGISQTRKYKKLDSPQKRQDYLQNLFFKDLNELSRGNITVAMLFWQRSIQEVLSDKLVVYPQIKIDFSFLYQLSYEELFTLAAFMQHEILNDEQHALIFHQNIKKSALIFNRLRNNGIILPHPNGYYIHPFLYRAIISTLISKNILH